MKALLAIGVFALVAPLAAGETKLGTGVTLKDSTANQGARRSARRVRGQDVARRRRSDRRLHAHGMLDGSGRRG